MGRPRNFEELQVVKKASSVFARVGYNATSVEDLVEATGLQRGSLYKAFGSKRNLFERALATALQSAWAQNRESLDLLIVALKELAPIDRSIASTCKGALDQSPENLAQILGHRLLENLWKL